jgi:hypothetical protein
MSNTPIGLGKILLAKRGTLSAAQQPIFGGLRAETDFVISDDEQVPTDRQLKLPNKTKNALDIELYEGRLASMQKVIEHYLRDAGADATWLLPSGKRINFQDDNCLGVTLDFTLDEKIRKMKLSLANSLPYDSAKQIIDYADMVGFPEPSYWTANIANYFRRDNYIQPNLFSMFFTATTIGVSGQLIKSTIKSRKLELKSSGEKNIFGQENGSWIEASGEVVLLDASLANLRSMRDAIFDHGMTITEKVGINATSLEQYIFGTGAVSFYPELTQGDKNSQLKISFTGKIANTAANIVFAGLSDGTWTVTFNS